jgi:hypothetical protein
MQMTDNEARSHTQRATSVTDWSFFLNKENFDLFQKLQKMLQNLTFALL